MTDVSQRTHAFCTACGAPIVDGDCSAACPSSRPTNLIGHRVKNPAPVTVQATVAATNAEKTALARATAPVDSQTAVTSAMPSRRRRMTIVPAGAVAAALLISCGVAVAGYLQRGSEIDDLEQIVNEIATHQVATDTDLAHLRATVARQADRLALTRSELQQHPEAAKVARTAEPSVFTIDTDSGLGSGFVVTSNIHRSKLVTNYHVIEEQYRTGDTAVTVRRGDTSYDGTIVDVSQANDLALIEVDHRLPALDVVIDHAAVGDPVLALGSPLGFGGTVTSGIVSSYRELADGAGYLQFSAPISPGNSGGPVLNETGQVLGVTVLKFIEPGAEGLSYAIPSDRLCATFHVC